MKSDTFKKYLISEATKKPFNVGSIEEMVLFKCEMLGQISDGFWENSRPDGHWRYPATFSNNISINPSKIGTWGEEAGKKMKKYTFENSQLFSYVGERMTYTLNIFMNAPEKIKKKILKYGYSLDPSRIWDANKQYFGNYFTEENINYFTSGKKEDGKPGKLYTDKDTKKVLKNLSLSWRKFYL